MVLVLLSHHYVEDHHQHKAKGEADGREVGVGAGGGFGDEFFDDHVQHRACSESQQIRHGGQEEGCQKDNQQTTNQHANPHNKGCNSNTVTVLMFLCQLVV